MSVRLREHRLQMQLVFSVASLCCPMPGLKGHGLAKIWLPLNPSYHGSRAAQAPILQFLGICLRALRRARRPAAGGATAKNNVTFDQDYAKLNALWLPADLLVLCQPLTLFFPFTHRAHSPAGDVPTTLGHIP